MPKRSARRPKRSGGSRSVTLTKKQIREKLYQQRQNKLQRQQRDKAYEARDRFKVRKADKGNLVLVGVEGKRNPSAKGRKGYLVYVTKTGKKRLVKQAGVKQPYRPRKISDIEPPATRWLNRARKKFQRTRLEKVAEGKGQLRGSGEVSVTGQFDFSDKVVTKIAKSIKKALEAQAAKRSFLITAMVLVELADGSTKVVEVVLPIDKPDHIAIELGGIFNFVRLKFYAFMARELAFLGYVTSGSANHIRRLSDNQGLDREEWTDSIGKPWQGADMETVKIRHIEWRIEQAT